MESREVIIELKDVHKAFRVYYDKGSMLKERFVNPGRSHYELREVLKGVSYKINRGETVALIGENGCGKSTTLKMLTRILYPNSGTVKVNGKVSSLIELGAGFHPDMSGRENIYINASILGVPEKEVDKRIDEIIRFSELEEFIDNPVRTYSSGMYMRLAFSVAINVDADILLIDEILAVGDQAFQEKCINKLNELRAEGVTVVLVSHSMGQVKEIADRCIWIDSGRVIMDGDTQDVCDAYEAEMERKRVQRDISEEEERKNHKQKNVENKEKDNDEDKIEKTEVNLYTLSGVRLAGIIGIAFMILASATQDIYQFGYCENIKYTLKQQMSAFSLLSIGKLGGAVLLLCAGYILLGQVKERVTRFTYIKFLKCFFCPLLFIWEFCILLYQVFLGWFSGSGFLIKQWIRSACFLEPVGMSNEWLIRSILLFALISPFIVSFLKRFDSSIMQIIIALVWIIFFLFPGLDLLGQANGGVASITYHMDLVNYMFYFCMGYYLSKGQKSIFQRKKEVIFIIITMIGAIGIQIFMYERNVNYFIESSHFLISIGAILIFDVCNWTVVTLRRIGLNWVVKWLDIAAVHLAGVYIIYRPVEMVLAGVLNNVSFLMMCLKVIILWIATGVISILISYIIARLLHINHEKVSYTDT